MDCTPPRQFCQEFLGILSSMPTGGRPTACPRWISRLTAKVEIQSIRGDQKVVCVVEEAPNIVGIETTRQFSGLYHVLHGALSPLKGIGPEQLKIKSLVERIGAGGIEEIIAATNPTVEGEATAVYLSKLLKPLGVKVTRIAMGIPVGSDIEFADEVTMWKAMEGRREM